MVHTTEAVNASEEDDRRKKEVRTKNERTDLLRSHLHIHDAHAAAATTTHTKAQKKPNLSLDFGSVLARRAFFHFCLSLYYFSRPYRAVSSNDIAYI